MKFKLQSPFHPTGDQPQAIDALTTGFQQKQQHQTLLGVTGSGKTFTIANVIQKIQKPTLIIAHNKTLAAQLYQEFRDFFPQNAVSYFVSYYDYYQPEAYIPSSDTYIEKEATINDEIDKLRLATTTNLLTRTDVIVIASVSCIYNLGSPVEYAKYIMELIEGQIIDRRTLIDGLQTMQYERSDHDFKRGTFRIRGDILYLWPAYQDKALKIDTLENQITSIDWIDPISGTKVTSPYPHQEGKLARYIIYPAKHYMMNPHSQESALAEIEHDLQKRIEEMKQQGKVVETYRLQQKVQYDLEMLKQFGFVNGIENYSRYFDGRNPGETPHSLIDHFQANADQYADGSFLTVVDESHITLPQIKGMYFGDKSRKETLIEYGFRLPSALDNRPLTFDEFINKCRHNIYVSATPGDKEISLSDNRVVEQLLRPTGLIDPSTILRRTEEQIEDLVIEIINRKKRKQRVLVTTLTKRMAEALTDYLNDKKKIDQLLTSKKEKVKNQEKENNSEQVLWAREDLPIDTMDIGPIEDRFYSESRIDEKLLHSSDHSVIYPKVAYLHSDIETLERSDILDELRRGSYDVVVGINLLREGLDLPEVSLVAILDADKEGFLRSETSLIQTMGRGARHQEGIAILYADKLTKSMKAAITETQRRRNIQIKHNLKHNIMPTSIQKPIRKRMLQKKKKQQKQTNNNNSNTMSEELLVQLTKNERIDVKQINPQGMTPDDRKKMAAKLKRRMNQAAKDMDFELAAILRDTISSLNKKTN